MVGPHSCRRCSRARSALSSCLLAAPLADGSDHGVPAGRAERPVRHHERARTEPCGSPSSGAASEPATPGSGGSPPAGPSRSSRSRRTNAFPSAITRGPDGALWFTEGFDAEDRADHDRRQLHGVPGGGRRRAGPGHRRRARRCAVVHRGRPDRADHDDRRRHAVLAQGRRRAERHRRGARRRTVVHGAERQQDRPDHDRRRPSPSSPSRRPAASPRGSPRARTAPCGSRSSRANKIGARHDRRGRSPSSPSARPRAVPGRSPPGPDGALWFVETLGAEDRPDHHRRRDHRLPARGPAPGTSPPGPTARCGSPRTGRDRPHHDRPPARGRRRRNALHRGAVQPAADRLHRSRATSSASRADRRARPPSAASPT